MRRVGLGLVLLVVAAWPSAQAATPVLRVAYAGSMGVVMDRAAGPAFAKTHHVTYQGIGHGSYGLARLLAAGQMRADVFIAITSGPVRLLQQDGRVRRAVPVASTQMAISWSPHSRYAARFRAAAQGKTPWYTVLETPGLRFGRTDPKTDPQGRNTLLMLQLAARHYRQPGLMQRIAGPPRNPRQVFTETSLLSRLEAGQIDATAGYLSAIRSHHLPALTLPPAINLGDPARMATSYRHAGITLADGKTLRVQPLVFYAAVLSNARHPRLARDFIAFLRSARGQAMLREHGYSPPHGPALNPVDKPTTSP
ncbi:extracellular solute-binding protein [Oleiagrimonas sp.]|jgi:molybdate/tungstate transport system substrate-binding protein|uniref:extracellular solute-binding protein n=1 Tax=Oleiagrimonas sp. TaxID=2010330 RepID=UPI002618287A|nr:extracellular solute-binding protein [Oleiagrimonas sp.]MDA3914985.1 extracellular solute-binding protein [Oleiagrimonas sp.]